MQPDTSGPGSRPEPKDLQFRAKDEDTRRVAQLRRRWRWLACVQVLVIVSVTGLNASEPARSG